MASHTQQKRGSANSKKRGHFWRKRTAPLRPERGKTPNYTISLQESDYQGRIYSQISFTNTQKLSPTILWFGAALLRLFLMFSHTFRSKNLAPFHMGTFGPQFCPILSSGRPRTCKTVTSGAASLVYFLPRASCAIIMPRQRPPKSDHA